MYRRGQHNDSCKMKVIFFYAPCILRAPYTVILLRLFLWYYGEHLNYLALKEDEGSSVRWPLADEG